MEGKGLIFSFFLNYQLLIESGILSSTHISKTSTRVLTVSSVFSFLTVSTVFKSEMLHSFTKIIYEYPIDNMDDIVRFDLKCYVAEDMKLLYQSSASHSQYISKCVTIQEHDDQQEILLSAALDQDIATISRLLKLKFAINTLLERNYDGEYPHLIERQVKFDFLFLYITKGYPLYERIFQLIGWINSAGFTAYFRQVVNFKVEKVFRFKQKIESRNLKFAQISIAFYMVLAGMGLSFIVFLLELSFRCPLRKRD